MLSSCQTIMPVPEQCSVVLSYKACVQAHQEPRSPWQTTWTCAWSASASWSLPSEPSKCVLLCSAL